MLPSGRTPSGHVAFAPVHLAPLDSKCGNSHCRWMLVECAQHFRKAPKIGSALTTRQEGQGKAVKELSWRMQNRLHKRYVKLKARGVNENKAIVALAREPSGARST